MQTASRVFYIIGKIVNIVEIAFAVLGVICGIVMLAIAPDIATKAASEGVTELDTPEKVRAIATSLLIGTVIALAVAIVILCLAIRASKAIRNGEKSSTPHIIMLVIGIFGDIFYFLGGLFGILSVDKANTKTTE